MDIRKQEILAQLNNSIQRITRAKSRLIKLSSRFSYYRLIVFFPGVFISLALYFLFSNAAGYILFAVIMLSFGLIAGRHNKINTAIRKFSHWINIKEIQAARIKIDWNNLPLPESNKNDDQHSFNTDLSITGIYSIHRLLDNTVSHEGGKLLKSWLLTESPDLNTILRRQELVKEIMPLQRFRDKLILNSLMISPEKLESEKFIKWLSFDNSADKLARLIPYSFVLIISNIVLILGYLLWGIPPLFSITLLVYSGLYFFNLKLVSDSFDKAMHIESELGKLYSIFDFLEKYPFGKNQRLAEFCSPLLNEKTSPRMHFKKIRNLINALSLRQNPLMALILNLLVPWDFYLGFKLEREKQSLAVNLHQWLDTWHNLQALNSLAEFAFLNPEYVFPTFNPTEYRLDAEGVAHPLIPHTINVRNNFRMPGIGTVDIITGSNMSGKSTFLKSLGTNMVLAYAGAPVNAVNFKTHLFRVFTCIKIDDSVTDGVSYFYAEVKRLKKLLEALNLVSPLPLFFLIDEIFRGTNNKERLAGSRAYIKAIGGMNGSGLVSTHDLELVKLEKEMPFIRNFHFREEAIEGKLIFDYKLRPGPSPTTNALIIMQLEGLPIED